MPPGPADYHEKPLENTDEQWNDWRWQTKNSINTLEKLERVINLTAEERDGFQKTQSEFAMSITPYYASLMDKDDPTCPIRQQAVPSLKEMEGIGYKDSLGEESFKVAPGLIHRYPDRALFLVNNMCQVYCRHCTRKRLTSLSNTVLSKADMEQSFQYLRQNPQVRDVLISGGDPLMLSDSNLEYVISNLRKIESIEIIRIGTRAPVTIPQRITDDLVNMLKKYHPLWINTHFNHPKEMTETAKIACNKISDAGIPLGNQTVLLRGINSSPRIMKELMHVLVKNRVRPYYIYQCDLESGLEHFRTTVQTGIEIMDSLRGWTSGYAVPTFVIDAPGGGGKIPVNPNYLISITDSKVKLRSFDDKIIEYQQPREKDPTCAYDKTWTSSVVDGRVYLKIIK